MSQNTSDLFVSFINNESLVVSETGIDGYVYSYFDGGNHNGVPAHKFKLLIRKSDGRINGSQLVSQHSKKQFSDWKKNKQTKVLIETMKLAGKFFFFLGFWVSENSLTP